MEEAKILSDFAKIKVGAAKLIMILKRKNEL
jgi:hypothetical protein